MGNDVARMIAQSSAGSRTTKNNIESVYAEEYKETALNTIVTCRFRLAREFGQYRMSIGGTEFQQVFEGVLGDPMEHFALFDTRGKGVVDVLEVFAAAILLSADQRGGYAAKIETLFALFDLDGSRRLNEVEVEIMLESVVRGAARVAMMPQPEDVLDSAGRLTASLFHHSKKHLETGEVSLEDLKSWVSHREDVSLYLSCFSEARMVISSIQLVDESVTRGVAMFNRAAAQDERGDGMVDGDKAAEILLSLTVLSDTEACTKRERETAAEPDAAAAVCMMLAGSSNAIDIRHAKKGRGRVGLGVLREFLKSWAVFSVVDDEGLGCVGSDDVKALLWLGGSTAGEEPSEAAVQKTTCAIDESCDGVVRRMEWMQYTAVLDDESGSMGFDGGLVQVFRRYDDDRSGSITADEMSMMVRDSVVEALAEARESVSVRPDMEAVVETLVQDIARDLVAVMDAAGSGVVGFTEFKKNQSLVANRLATLRDFVFSVALQQDGSKGGLEPTRLVEDRGRQSRPKPAPSRSDGSAGGRGGGGGGGDNETGEKGHGDEKIISKQ